MTTLPGTPSSVNSRRSAHRRRLFDRRYRCGQGATPCLFRNRHRAHLLRRLIFENNRTGFQNGSRAQPAAAASAWLTKWFLPSSPPATTTNPWRHWLLEQEHMLVLVSNKAIAENRQTLDGRWDKNDTKDSANVADLVVQGKCQFFDNPEADLVEIRRCCRCGSGLKENEHRCACRSATGWWQSTFRSSTVSGAAVWRRTWPSCAGAWIRARSPLWRLTISCARSLPASADCGK